MYGSVYQDSKSSRCRFLAVRTYNLHVYPIQNSISQRALTVRELLKEMFRQGRKLRREVEKRVGAVHTIRLPAGLFRQWGGGGIFSPIVKGTVPTVCMNIGI
jgi:hypothetical protein